MTSLKEKYEVVVIGGGIAGLVTALGLSKLGINILVVEKGKKVNSNGADVLKPTGITILSELNIIDDLIAKEARKRSLVDIYYNGNLLANMDYKTDNKMPYFYLCPYQVVVSTVIEKINNTENITLLTETSLTNITENKEGIVEEIVLNGTNKVKADVIVGADGGNSTLRNLSRIPAEVVFYEQAMYFNHFPLVESVDKKNRLYVSSDFHLAYFYPVNHTRFRSVIGFPKEEGKEIFSKGVEHLRSVLKKFVSESDDAIQAIDTTDGFATFPLCKMNLSQYAYGNRVFIGNAAHAIHPISGQGMNLAIEDAGQLIKSLTEYFKGKESLENCLTEFNEVRQFINQKVVSYADGLASNFNHAERFARSLNLKIQTSGREEEVLNTL